MNIFLEQLAQKVNLEEGIKNKKTGKISEKVLS